MALSEFIEKWKRLNPRFTGSVEFHFFAGELRDIKSTQRHPLPKEKNHAMQEQGTQEGR